MVTGDIAAKPPEGDAMNFVVIMNDTLRPDHLSAYGATDVITPHAAAFAEQAAVFDHAYVGSFPTIPNRTDLFTGRYGEPFHPWLPLSFDKETLPDILRRNGYVTQLICDTPHLINGGHNFDWPFNAWDFIRGQEIDRYGMDSDPIDLPYSKDTKVCNPKETNRSIAQYLRNVRGQRNEEDTATFRTCQRVIRWLERNRNHDKFFLWVDAFDPHEPNCPPEKYTNLYDPGYAGDQYIMHVSAPALLTDAEINNVIARYKASVTFVDRCFGRILQTIDDLGLGEDTCVVWMSDHGTHLNEHGKMLTKACTYDEIARTVLMVRMPGREAAGQRFAELVQPADFAPTLLDLAGLGPMARAQGTSYAALLRGESCHVRDVAISAGGAIDMRGKSHPIVARDGRWTLLDRPDPALRELYDNSADPQQLTNVVDAHPAEAQRLHEAVLEFLRTHDAPPQIVRLYETNDPGDMTGFVGRPPGYEHYRFYVQHLLNSEVVPE